MMVKDDTLVQHFRVHASNLFLMGRGWYLSVIVANATIVTLECANWDNQMRH